MLHKCVLLIGLMLLLDFCPSCNHNKIACPTYADSFPEKKGKKKKNEPQVQKASKPIGNMLPPGYGK